MISAAADLARRLARDAEAVCRHYLSNGHRQGHYWVIGDVMNTPGRSLYVRLTGPDSGPGAAGKWTDAASPSEHGDLLDLIRLNRNLNGLGEAIDEARRFLALPRPPISWPTTLNHAPPAPSGSSEAARRLFRAGRPLPGTPAEAYLRARGITGRLDWPALRYHPSVYYRETDNAPLESWPALLAAVTDLDEQHHRHPAHLARSAPCSRRRRSPIRAAPSAICSATAFASALPGDILAAGEGIETMLALKSVLPSLPVIAGLSANHLAALDLPPALRRLYVARDNDAAGLRAATAAARTRHRRRYRNPRTRAGPWRLQPRPLPSRPRGHAGTSRRSARPLRPDALSARYPPLRSAAVSPTGHPGLAAPRRKEEGLFVCGGGVLQPEKSRACGLPERRSAGGETGLQWRRPAIFRRRADHPTDTNHGEPAISPALQREAK